MSPAETATISQSPLLRVVPRLLIGLTILSAGLLWTLDNLNLVDSDRYTRWWPAVVIVIGVVRMFDPASNKLTSAVIALIGVGLLFDTLDYWHFDLGDLFPLLFAIIGGKLVLDVLRRRPPARTDRSTDADSVVHSFAFMAGVGKRSVSHDYRGGDANAIMGGVELDLREAQIAPGQEAVLDAFAFWGGVEIRVPETWRVASQVMPIMGAYEDNTAGKGGGSGPTLVIRGVAIMGAIEVKN